ncbi:translation initiation factor eIF-2B alpha subunit [Dictyostelium discoideum AX4]|uniref:Methylthioribose-1-phosphate isomerase n=1 Tax=Dictyostelium discoideum TaxID=44689 RepID=Q54R90_DICDI|nr:translation initiation factor eIF-2B alpha subunit [Dictyostelium discoideum AX4]EAL65795.1 translation initiation factor eIF-2B alpha subunit [Dictyostelium discoideum AX4]|eukprot:XP_639157.1 translation initiation factor eIF-2B alpha subunit [Dictyostelium discoideum AX4]
MESFNYLSIRYNKDEKKLQILDQRKLPDIEEWLVCEKPEDMITFIKQLSVRGAPLIGVAASMSLYNHILYNPQLTKEEIVKVSQELRESRPTAVNLMFAIDEMMQLKEGNVENRDYSATRFGEIAMRIIRNEVDMCDKMSKFGASLIQPGESILTHCNTGSVATVGAGTALGVIREAHKQGKNIHVYVDETRPLLQGGRLTTYELEREGIPYTLICDNMAACLMRDGKIQRVLVGADRIAANGDFANKIGTYSVAVLANHHNIPFHCVAPMSTVDIKCLTGKDIPIEERSQTEVQGASGAFGQVRWAPKNSKTFNPAFDVTPMTLVTSIILDTGILTKNDLNKLSE